MRFIRCSPPQQRSAQRDELPQPQAVEPVTLLSEPDGLVGQWLRMDLETVQVTRIAVTEPHRQAQLGSDHYYQIDAVGDLKNVVVKIERPERQPSVRRSCSRIVTRSPSWFASCPIF